MNTFCFESVHPYAEDILALPVVDLDAALTWYCEHFGMEEVRRNENQVVVARDGFQIGFEINGKDPSNEGAAILVSDASAAKTALETMGIETANWRVDERDGKKFQVFFVVAPDGLCYYFHQEISV